MKPEESSIKKRHGRWKSWYKYRVPDFLRRTDDDEIDDPHILWYGFLENTTVHGLPNLGKSRGLTKNCFWLVAMIIMTVGLCYNIRGLALHYLRYPITVSINLVQQQKELTFPAVTICNMNPVRKSALTMASENAMNTTAVKKKRRWKRASTSQCPSGWYYCRNNCYLVVIPLANQIDARTDCKKTPKADLVSILSVAEQDCVCNVTTDYSWYWIGRYKATSSTTDDSYWLDNSVSSYLAWSTDPKQPTNVDRCVMMISLGRQSSWYTQDCDNKYNYICKISLASATTTKSATTQRKTTAQKTTAKITTARPTTTKIAQKTTTQKTTTQTTKITLKTTQKTTARDSQKTTTQKTTIQATSVPESTTVQKTTVRPSTSQKTTMLSTTVQRATPQQMTVQQATVQQATVQKTTLLPTTVQQTTSRQTTVQQTVVKQTTVQQATLQQTAVQQTTVQQTTVQQTAKELTGQITTLLPTTTQQMIPRHTTAQQTTVQQIAMQQSTMQQIAVQQTGKQSTGQESTLLSTTVQQMTPRQTTVQQTDSQQNRVATTINSLSPFSAISTYTDTTEDKSEAITETLTNIIQTTTLQGSTDATVNTGLTTEQTSQSSMQLLMVECCCKCCHVLFDEKVCRLCNNQTLDVAIECSTNISMIPTTQVVILDERTHVASESNFLPSGSLNGSKFSDRLAFDPIFLKGEVFIETLAALPKETKMDLGYSLKDMVADCKFSGQDCDFKDFEFHYNSLYGNCFVFNSGWNHSKTLHLSTSSGIHTGLELVMNIHQEDYITDIGDTAGIRVVISDQGIMPFPEDEGMTIIPGHYTSVSIRRAESHLLPYPHDRCTMEPPIGPRWNVFASIYPVNYSREACQKTCYQRHVIEACSCTDSYYPDASAFDLSNIPVCSTVNITQDDCKYEVNLKFRNNQLNCDCPDLCDISRYEFHTSLGIWPSVASRESTLKTLSRALGPNFNIANYKMVKQNILKFEIYFEDLGYKVLQELPGYPLLNFLSDLGVVGGLWFGFAFFSGLEVMEFFLDIAILSIRRYSCLNNRVQICHCSN